MTATQTSTTASSAPTAPAPGLYPRVPYEQYRAWDAASNTLLGYFAKSAAHARHYLTSPPDPTEAQDLGVAAHVAIFEPDRFDALFAEAPECDKRTTAGKKLWADFVAANPGKEILTSKEHALCLALRDAIYTGEVTLAADLLRGKGQNEISAVWRDAETELLCKGRLDRFTQHAGWACVVDVKTTRDASESGFPREVARYSWHRQAAFYLDGLNVLAPARRRFIHVAIEKDPPYAVAVHELETDALEEGRRAYRSFLFRYAECLRTNRWPGYPNAIQPLSIPAWAYFHGDLRHDDAA